MDNLGDSTGFIPRSTFRGPSENAPCLGADILSNAEGVTLILDPPVIRDTPASRVASLGSFFRLGLGDTSLWLKLSRDLNLTLTPVIAAALKIMVARFLVVTAIPLCRRLARGSRAAEGERGGAG